MVDQRQAFDKLLDNNRKASSNIPSSSDNKTNSQPIPNHSAVAPSLQALNAEKSSFWIKYKQYIIIGGIILLVIIIIVIIIIIYSSQSSGKKINEKISDESTLE
jgi:hypothetical protein